jgi:endoglucanase
MSFTYWSWNPNSGDTGGIALDDWYSINQTKQALISPYLIPPVGGGTQTSPPPVTTSSPPPVTTTSPPPVTTTSPPPVTTTPPPPTGACTATYTTVNSYPGGFQGEVTVTAGSSAISGWNVTWTLAGGQGISQLWSGSYTPNGSAVSVRNLNWNGQLAAGRSTTFGFIGSGTASTPTLTCAAA